MAVTSIYITDPQFVAVLADLNIDSLGATEQQELLDRAIGDMEADLVERYIVPLLAENGGAFSTSPAYTRAKILNTIKAKIRQLIGIDKNRNLIIDSTQRYIDVHGKEYTDCMKVLLDPKKVFGLQQQTYAQGAVTPVQEMGLGVADNEPSVGADPWVL